MLLLAAFIAAFLGLVIALSTQFEAAWIGSPIRPWTLYAMPVAAAGIAAEVPFSSAGSEEMSLFGFRSAQ